MARITDRQKAEMVRRYAARQTQARIGWDVNTPSRKRDGFSDKLRGTPPASRPKARSWPLAPSEDETVCFSLGRLEFYERHFAAQPLELPQCQRSKSRTGLSVQEQFQLQRTEPAVSVDFTSNYMGPRFRRRINPAVPARVH
jgi:hypothetical protein